MRYRGVFKTHSNISMMGSKKRSLQSDFLAGIHMIGTLAVNLLRAVSLKNLTSRFKERRDKSDIYLFKIK